MVQGEGEGEENCGKVGKCEKKSEGKINRKSAPKAREKNGFGGSKTKKILDFDFWEGV